MDFVRWPQRLSTSKAGILISSNFNSRMRSAMKFDQPIIALNAWGNGGR